MADPSKTPPAPGRTVEGADQPDVHVGVGRHPPHRGALPLSSPTAADTGRPLTDLVNVGPSVNCYFATVHLEAVEDLVGGDPVEIFDAMCAAAGTDLDPCLLDTVMSAVDQADGEPARPWWTYSEERKAQAARRR